MADWVDPFVCLECGAPAEIRDGHFLYASLPDGGAEQLWADIIECSRGHRYHLIDETRTVTA